jgi:PAS domain-containing protein
MANQPIELILARQFADSMSVAVFLVDPIGNLLFYNEAAEGILGIRFAETGSMAVDEWSQIFIPTYEDGRPFPPEDMPLVRTLTNQQPAHGSFCITNKKGEKHFITVTSFPIEGRPDRNLGAMAMFWKPK